jgi:hypothetical protein
MSAAWRSQRVRRSLSFWNTPRGSPGEPGTRAKPRYLISGGFNSAASRGGPNVNVPYTMPVLDNPKHEHFAVNVAKGLTATKAYTSAGYSQAGSRQSAASY